MPRRRNHTNGDPTPPRTSPVDGGATILDPRQPAWPVAVPRPRPTEMPAPPPAAGGRGSDRPSWWNDRRRYDNYRAEHPNVGLPPFDSRAGQPPREDNPPPPSPVVVGPSSNMVPMHRHPRVVRSAPAPRHDSGTTGAAVERAFEETVQASKAASAYTVLCQQSPKDAPGARLEPDDNRTPTATYTDEYTVDANWIAAPTGFCSMWSFAPSALAGSQSATALTGDACTALTNADSPAHAYLLANALFQRVVGMSMSIEQDGAVDSNAGNYTVVDAERILNTAVAAGSYRTIAEFDSAGVYGETGTLAGLGPQRKAWCWQPSGTNPQAWLSPASSRGINGVIAVLLRSPTAVANTVRFRIVRQFEFIPLPAMDSIEVQTPLATQGLIEDVANAASAAYNAFSHTSTFAAGRDIAQRAKALWMRWAGPIRAGVGLARQVSGLLAAKRSQVAQAHRVAHALHILAIQRGQPEDSPYHGVPRFSDVHLPTFYALALSRVAALQERAGFGAAPHADGGPSVPLPPPPRAAADSLQGGLPPLRREPRDWVGLSEEESPRSTRSRSSAAASRRD